MKESDLEDLIAKGKTKAYTFKSQAGKSFKAKLVLDKSNHKTRFEFVDSKPKGSSSKKAEPKQSSWGAKKSTSSSSGWGKKKTGWGKK